MSTRAESVRGTMHGIFALTIAVYAITLLTTYVIHETYNDTTLTLLTFLATTYLSLKLAASTLTSSGGWPSAE